MQSYNRTNPEFLKFLGQYVIEKEYRFKIPELKILLMDIIKESPEKMGIIYGKGATSFLKNGVSKKVALKITAQGYTTWDKGTKETIIKKAIEYIKSKINGLVIKRTTFTEKAGSGGDKNFKCTFNVEIDKSKELMDIVADSGITQHAGQNVLKHYKFDQSLVIGGNPVHFWGDLGDF